MRFPVLAPQLALLLIAASCGGESPASPSTPTQPTPVQVAPLTLVCTAPPPLRTTTGTPVPLAYAAPSTTGGTSPVAVACTPAIGIPAPVGQTAVNCTATDAQSRTASCTFSVTVAIAPTLSVERLLALGDSFTYGTTSRAPARVIPGNNYVQKLESLLRERYPDQQFSVMNAGISGQFMDQIEDRYPGALRQSSAQLLILEGGANDINTDGMRAVGDVITRIERITRDAQGRRVAVVLSTLTPHRPGSPRGTAPDVVRELNTRIRDLCRRYQTGCADLYAAFGNEQSPLIGSDGLHPTLAGYDVIAETYFDVIRRLFERTATPSA